MEPESLICLFDSLWFNHGFFKKHTNPSSPPISDPPKKIPLNIIAIPVPIAVSKKQKSRMRGSRREGAEKETPQRIKSISELELEELKGFMDLGFEFSEEDAKNSSLVEIIPGLNTLMKKKSCDKAAENYPKLDNSKPRPYLSEAWEAMEEKERRKMKKALLAKWRIPAMSNEADMKHNLRWWAHTVASTLR
ncbi:uncharacterized protein LOC116016570 [Ipomoea triloba]|uniref:uncharacterized protein LOC116016570 n=1 Tax=Ipomoea triloba TaxID=35885 RepID=UPI00125E19AD|nr:uncharacterized protein LOC116016570 [Ipomoea triloba]